MSDCQNSRWKGRQPTFKWKKCLPKSSSYAHLLGVSCSASCCEFAMSSNALNRTTPRYELFYTTNWSRIATHLVLLPLVVLIGATSSKNLTFNLSFQIGLGWNWAWMLFTRRLSESEFWYDVILQGCDHDVISRRIVLPPHGECTRSICPASYATASASSWSIVHS